MKVLSKPNVSQWAMEIECDQCSAKLEVNKTDLTAHADSRDGDYYTCKCPVCQKSNAIAASLIPREVRAVM